MGRDTLPVDHPTALAFIDESGAIAHSRFFAVGCLKMNEPALLLRQIQHFRDRRHWYGEIHFADVKPRSLNLYQQVVDILAAAGDMLFSGFVADRDVADPVSRFGDAWTAYEKLATQLLVGSVRPREIVTVLADDYSAPDFVRFEQQVRAGVNARLGRLAVASVCRLNSKAADSLQLVDLLTSAVAFEFRQSVGEAGTTSVKAKLADHVRQAFGVASFLGGHRDARLNVAIYQQT